MVTAGLDSFEDFATEFILSNLRSKTGNKTEFTHRTRNGGISLGSEKNWL